MYWPTLSEFLIRLAAGTAFSLFLVADQRVPCGFFRVHSWVVMGCYTGAALFLWGDAATASSSNVPWLAVAGAVVSYLGSACWLYEWRRPGKTMLLLAVAMGLAGAIHSDRLDISPWQRGLESISAALVLGTVISSMFLGHWYLNTPSMQLAPLRRLLVAAMVAVGLRAVASVPAAWSILERQSPPANLDMALLALRWLAGLVGTWITVLMAWQTLKIPNTQSATGIAYVSVVLAFIGELTAQLMLRGPKLPV